jgi:sugar lactone lactonase YvrE
MDGTIDEVRIYDRALSYRELFSHYQRRKYIDPEPTVAVENHVAHAVGWIGGGTDGWQTGTGTVSGTDYQSFDRTFSIVVDSSGNIYCTDMNNQRVCKWSSDGSALGWIGGGTDGWQNGPAPTASTNFKYFSNPSGLFLDSTGNLYISEQGNHRISKWDTSGNAIGWIGDGQDGWQTGAGASSGNDLRSFTNPKKVFVDGCGYIYIADRDIHRISKWDRYGNAIGWIGGGQDGWQVGSGSSSGSDYQSFYQPRGLWVDREGNIFVTETDNHRVSKWSRDGVALGYIGGGTNGWKITNGATAGSDIQSFNHPYHVCKSRDNLLYITDRENHRISVWDEDGNAVGWIGGGLSGIQTTSGASLGTDTGYFNYPTAHCLDLFGNIYVSDDFNFRICKWRD